MTRHVVIIGAGPAAEHALRAGAEVRTQTRRAGA